MPTPGKNEKQKDFISRCIPIVLKEGGSTKSKASGKCHGIWRQHKGGKRDLTLNEKSSLVHATWEKTYGAEGMELQYTWPRYVFEDYLVVTVQGKYIKVPYSWGDDGVELSDPKEWTVVEHSFKTRIVPLPVRAVDGGLYKVYGAVFGDKDHRDAYETYFDADTDYHLDWYDKRPWLYHHGLHPMMGLVKMGDLVSYDTDEEGLFFLGEMAEHFKFKQAVQDLIEAEALYPSQGSLSHTIRVASNGHVDDWPMAEVSSTVAPANLYQKAITPEVSRAIRALQGGIMEEQKNPIAGLLGNLFSRKEPLAPPVDEVEGGVKAPVEETPSEPTMQITNWEEAGRALQIPSIVQAIGAIDEHIKTLSARTAQLEELLQGLAKNEVERTQNALKGDTWFKNLFSASRSGEEADDELKTKAQTPADAAAKESPGAYLLRQQQR